MFHSYFANVIIIIDMNDRQTIIHIFISYI